MLKTILCNKDNLFSEVANPEDISDLIADDNRLVWLDLAAPTEADFRLLRAEFGLHPLAIEDAMTRHQRPKVDQYENFYLVVFYAVYSQEAPARVPGRDLQAATKPAARHSHGAGKVAAPAAMDWSDNRVVLRELAMFMGSNWLITVHQEPIDELEEVKQRWQRNVEAITGQDVPGLDAGAPPRPPNTPGGNGTSPRAASDNDIGILLYSLLDTIVDSYFPIIDTLVDRIEDLEEQIFERFNPAALESIFALKKDLLALRKVLAPERDVLNVLTRRDLPIFKNHTLVYFQDVYDHVVRITDSIDTYRDLLSSALDSYLSMQSNRLNITVQTLTAASIILMALSLITGIYGTNFENIPGLRWTYGYFALLGVMFAIGLGLYAFFKRKGWL